MRPKKFIFWIILCNDVGIKYTYNTTLNFRISTTNKLDENPIPNPFHTYVNQLLFGIRYVIQIRIGSSKYIFLQTDIFALAGLNNETVGEPLTFIMLRTTGHNHCQHLYQHNLQKFCASCKYLCILKFYNIFI